MKLKIDSTFNGYSIRKAGEVTLSFSIPESQLADAMRSVIFLNKRVACGVVLEGRQIKIGYVVFQRLVVDRNGASKITMESDIHSLSITSEDVRDMMDRTVVLYLAYDERRDEDEEHGGRELVRVMQSGSEIDSDYEGDDEAI